MESTFFTLKTNQQISKQTTHKYIDCNPFMFFKDITKSHYLKMLIKFFFLGLSSCSVYSWSWQILVCLSPAQYTLDTSLCSMVLNQTHSICSLGLVVGIYLDFEWKIKKILRLNFETRRNLQNKIGFKKFRNIDSFGKIIKK